MVHALGLFSSSSPLERVIVPNKPTVVVVAVGLGGAASEMPLPLQQRVRVASVSPPFCCPPSLSFCGLRLRAKERGAALTHSLTHSFAITSLPEFTFRCRERRGPRSLGSNLTHEQVGAAKGSASLLLGSLFSIFDPLYALFRCHRGGPSLEFLGARLTSS